MATLPFTAYRAHKIRKGLSLEERRNALSFYARATLRTKTHYLNTETRDFDRAVRIAESWFRRLDSNATNTAGSVRTAYELYLSNLERANKRSVYAWAQVQWSVIRSFFADVDCAGITTRTIKQFIECRQHDARKDGRTLKPSTLYKNLVAIRGILKAAQEEGWISQIPDFPSVGSIKPNPRPWLEPEEWQTLERVAKARIKEKDLNPRTKRQREELWDFCLMMVHTGARVDEVRRLRVRDCVVKPNPKNPKRQYLELWIDGKTGRRKAIGWSGAVSAYGRLVKRNDLKPEDLLFTEHHRDGFRELLEAAHLRYDADGVARNLKSLRATGIAFRIRSNPRINLKLLGIQSGTSVQMLDTYYLKRLSVDAAIEELL